MRKIFTTIFSIYAMIIFLAVMLLIFPFVIIASFFGKIRGGNMVYNLCRFWADVVLFFWGIRHKNIYEAPKVTDQPAIFVFNHISYIDIPFLMKAFRKQPIRILGKAEMSKIPIFGFIYKNAVVSVLRSSKEARTQSIRELKKVLNKNISVVIAPEGTFNMTHYPLKDFYDGAFKIAIETETVIQPVVFLDSYDRMNYNSIFSITPGKSRAIFLSPTETRNYSLNELDSLKEKIYHQMEQKLIEENASWIKYKH